MPENPPEHRPGFMQTTRVLANEVRSFAKVWFETSKVWFETLSRTEVKTASKYIKLSKAVIKALKMPFIKLDGGRS